MFVLARSKINIQFWNETQKFSTLLIFGKIVQSRFQIEAILRTERIQSNSQFETFLSACVPFYVQKKFVEKSFLSNEILR